MFSWVRLSHLRQWSRGDWVRPPVSDLAVRAISTDSRTLKSGDVFLALKGDSFDGHDFIEDAISRGASALICETSPVTELPVIRVKSSLDSLVNIGREHRCYFKGRVMAITGSAGKSSTKEMTKVLLGEGAVASPASFNNLIGVSKTALLIEDNTRYLVLEMGMNAPGEIRQLCECFSPDAGLITNIGDAHVGRLGGKEGVYRAKKELFDYLSLRGKQCQGVAVNADDPLVLKALGESFEAPPPIVTYGWQTGKHKVSGKLRTMDPHCGFLRLRVSFDGDEIEFSLPIFGMHHSENILAAMAAALLLGVEGRQVPSRLGLIKPATHRGEIILLSGNRILIDESYNSNPSALRSSIDSVYQLDPARRRLLVLGEMRELESFSQTLHREAAQHVISVQKKVGFPLVVVAVGGAMSVFVEEFAREMPRVVCRFARDVKEATPIAQELGNPGDIILIKGSRGNRLDQTVTDLRKLYAQC